MPEDLYSMLVGGSELLDNLPIRALAIRFLPLRTPHAIYDSFS